MFFWLLSGHKSGLFLAKVRPDIFVQGAFDIITEVFLS